MKLKKLVLATLAAGALIGGALQANAQIEFHVDPGQTWFGYINSDTTSGNFVSTLPDNKAEFSGPNLLLYPNTSLFGQGGTFVEANTYQEVIDNAQVGQTVTFGWDTLAYDIPAGYDARGFIKVLDAFGSWATTQYEWAPLVAGQGGSLSFVVGAVGNTASVQAGFSLSGPALDPLDPDAGTFITIIPEPTTFALAGLGAAALLIFRRRS